MPLMTPAAQNGIQIICTPEMSIREQAEQGDVDRDHQPGPPVS